MMMVPKSEIESRLFKLRTRMDQLDVDLCLIFQNVDRFYFSGTMQTGVLLIPRNDQPSLFIKRTLSRAYEESPLEKVIQYEGLSSIYDYVVAQNITHRTIGIEFDVIPASLFLRLKELFSTSRMLNIADTIRTIRMIKSSFERSLLREAGRRFDRIFEELAKSIEPGISEYEVYLKFSNLLLEAGSSLVIRTRQFGMEATPKYILSGKSASRHSFLDSPSAGGDGITIAYPGGASRKTIEKGEPILIDGVCNYEGYNVDCTRIFALSYLEDSFYKAHEVSTECHRIFCEMATEKRRIVEIAHEIVGYVKSMGLQSEFMGPVRFIGHGIGLELDEYPFINERFDRKIESGMVIAFEPKFIFSEGAVGYEDTYYIDVNSFEVLTGVDSAIKIL